LLTRVKELLNPVSGTWDEELIGDVFWEEDVKYILATPTNPGHDDFLAWHFDQRGLFSVKSAYHVLDDEKHRLKTRQKGECSSNGREPKQNGAIWRKLWKLPCPPKVCHFIWRLAHNSLAVKMNISRRGVRLDTRCPVCFRFDEDGGHCFLKCKMIRRCWAALSLEPIRQMLLLKRSAWEVIVTVLGLKEDVCIMTMLLLWRWWSVRNKVNQGEKGLSADEVAADVLKLISDMGSTERQQPIHREAAVKKWNAPPQGQLKINTDGSFIPETLQGCWGFIVRDHEGGAVLAGAGRLGAAPDALSIEATACQQALQAATDYGISRIQVEVDSSVLQHALQSSTMDLATREMMIKDTRFMLQEHFVCSGIISIPGSCNSVAHDLAKFAMSWTDQVTYMFGHAASHNL
jgi:ribonuclease HI